MMPYYITHCHNPTTMRKPLEYCNCEKYECIQVSDHQFIFPKLLTYVWSFKMNIQFIQLIHESEIR